MVTLLVPLEERYPKEELGSPPDKWVENLVAEMNEEDLLLVQKAIDFVDRHHWSTPSSDNTSTTALAMAFTSS